MKIGDLVKVTHIKTGLTRSGICISSMKTKEYTICEYGDGMTYQILTGQEVIGRNIFVCAKPYWTVEIINESR